MTRQIFLDTETTGLNAQGGDRILELGCVEYIDRRPTGRHFHHYINPERDSDPDALRVHGLTTEFLSDKPKFAEIAHDLQAFLGGAEILIHNAPFDVGFLNAEFARLQLPSTEQSVSSITDTLAIAKSLYPGQHNNLDALCRRLEVDNSGRELHGALLDAELLAEVYIRLTREQSSLLSDEASSTDYHVEKEDLSHLDLQVLAASADELESHAAVLADIGRKTPAVWS